MDFLSHLLALSGVFFLLITLYLWRSKKTPTNKIKGKLAPEPSWSLPIIGHLHQVNSQKPIFRTFADFANKYGPIFTLRLGVHPVLVISNYEAVKECFTTNDVTFASRPMSAHGTYLGYDYAAFGFAPYGPYWRTMRKLALVELLSSRRLETLKHVHISEVETLIKDLYGLCKINVGDPTKVVISEWIEHFTLNIITEIIASKRYFDSKSGGIDGEAQRIEKLIKEYMYISGVPVVSDLIPVPKWIDIQGRMKSMKRIGKEVDVLLGSWVEEHIGKKEKATTTTTESNDNKQDFIDIMLSLLEESSELGYSRETVIKATVSVSFSF